uniref:Uncharacterized protein n=1 Tax=Candidatus Kentrum sp. FM TaxID=2126340 RepID=A0A450RY88_9GAMM|nr:MAG: hypothetical protein BECKFM1743C_GA0114222_100091 [Candidatus Kentron sp. FM]VFJ69807.1 MAG: hypothetical protein BECKFM1743A_GA0114220_105233 [Candidatus Kentron sp. FM]VFK06167.1 MAG: hypothetical protein BECKFM1743B_GA0114221_1001118 [Candidatus Kentron sp. FM]
MNQKTRKEQDQDMAQVLAALKRAARQARSEAERTGTPLVTYENGAIRSQMIVTDKKGQS